MSVLLPDGVNELGEIFGPAGLHTSLVPVVELYSGRTVALEAVVSASMGSTLTHPDLLESAARSTGLLAELDAVRWDGALRAVMEASPPANMPIFLRVEPDSLLQLPDLTDHPFGRGVLVVGQASLRGRTAQVLRTVAHARGLGWSIAVAGVGRGQQELTLLPLLDPDVIVLDPTVLQGPADYRRATLVQIVAAQAESSGASVMATGVDTKTRLQTALAVGATLGRGLACRGSSTRHGPLMSLPDPATRGTVRQSAPYSVAAAGRPELQTTKRLLVQMGKYLELAAQKAQPVLLLGTFQHQQHLTPRTSARWKTIAEAAALVLAFGVEMPAEPVPGVRGVRLDPNDPASSEWTLLVLAPHFAAVLCARDLGDSGPDMERRFNYVLSHERNLVITVARSLLTRVP